MEKMTKRLKYSRERCVFMIITAQYFWYYLRKFREKKIIVLFGEKESTKRLAEITNAAGYKVSYIVGNKEDGEIRSYLDLMYEDYTNLFVWIVSYDHLKYMEKLKDLGLIEHKNFASISRPPYMNLEERFILDVHLGYTSNTKGKYPGITIFGDESVMNKRQLKIATLGGSTSDAIAYPWKSWSEFIYEKLGSKYPDRNIIVYSAGVCAYNSSQELLKLQRDLVRLKPDIVLSYSGLNDSVLHSDLWTTSYQKIIFETVSKNQQFTIAGGKSELGYSVGISTGESMAEFYIQNMKMMNAICVAQGIKFYGFLQAMMGEESYILKDEEEELLRNCMNTVYEDTSRFIKDVKQQMMGLDFLHDLSQIFNFTQKVYIDTEHVNEMGNEIIADEIIKRVQWI